MNNTTNTTPSAPKPQRPWYKKKRIVIPGGLFALIVLGSAVGGEDTSGSTESKPQPAVTVTKSVTPTPSPASSKTTAAPKVSDDPKPSKAAAPAKKTKAAPAVVPNVVGTNHAAAMTKLHSKGFMVDEHSISPGNWWIADNSNWKVCSQDPAAGATDVLRVTINSVKLNESC
jgi:hypothetical protein